MFAPNVASVVMFSVGSLFSCPTHAYLHKLVFATEPCFSLSIATCDQQEMLGFSAQIAGWPHGAVDGLFSVLQFEIRHIFVSPVSSLLCTLFFEVLVLLPALLWHGLSRFANCASWREFCLFSLLCCVWLTSHVTVLQIYCCRVLTSRSDFRRAVIIEAINNDYSFYDLNYFISTCKMRLAKQKH